MAEVDALVLKNVKAFLDKVKLAGINVSKAYIFGSYITGQADKWSDIDVAVVLAHLPFDRFEERIRLTELAATIDDRIEPLPFTLERFVENDPLVRKIISQGLAIK